MPKKKWHSTVSRRDFMKALGLGAAGLGAAGATAPLFHDLDEVIASSEGNHKRPWWVKEVDEITTPVDWNVMQRWDPRPYISLNPTWMKSPEDAQKIRADNKAYYEQKLANGEPGHSIRDVAAGRQTSPPYLMSMVGEDHGWSPLGPLSCLRKKAAYEAIGTPKWQGTPEENAKMMRTMVRCYGGQTVGFLKLDDNIKKLFSHHGRRDKQQAVVFEDVEEPYEDDNKIVFPNGCSVIVWTQLRNWPATQSGATFRSWLEPGCEYHSPAIKLLRFLKDIGYTSAYHGADNHIISTMPAFSVLAGLGEMGRLQMVTTPEYGPSLGRNSAVFTKLPLPTTNPIDIGIERFCHTCSKCAEVCPTSSIPLYKEPSWEITPADPNNSYHKPELFNNPGLQTWYYDHSKCMEWTSSTTPSLGVHYCHLCQANCPFMRDDHASIHGFVRATVATTSIANGFFYNMDKLWQFKETPEDHLDDFWHLEDRAPCGYGGQTLPAGWH